MVEGYIAYQAIIRISSDERETVADSAEEIARVTAARVGVDGANVTYGEGLWKGAIEHSAAIEIVMRRKWTSVDLGLIRNHVTAMGLTAFVTTQEIGAFELY